MDILENIKFNQDGLIPAIAQDAQTSEVLMLAYMNEQSLKLTLKTGFAHYFSRSRNKLWKKGEESGHIQEVINVKYDCDGDTILLMVKQTGRACHTENHNCFFRNLELETKPNLDAITFTQKVIEDMYRTIENRKIMPKEGAYTNYLFDKGIDKILKKVGEETAEVIIASKNNDKQETVCEISDLMYHLSVLMVNNGVKWSDVYGELKNREEK